MADLKNPVDPEVVINALTASAIEHVRDVAAAVLREMREAHGAKLAIPKTTVDLLAATQFAWVKEFEVKDRACTLYGGQTALQLSGWNIQLGADYHEKRELPPGRYRALVVLLPVPE